ncbi:MAG: RNA polymerase sigma factor [Elusimicrobia bacterium]|nr:RNA polymerase sigma factor [Elusimicrobiota bacterium]
MTTAAGFEDFIREHQDMVYTTALRLLGRRQEAEDMAQEAFLKAYHSYEDLKQSPNVGGWLRLVTRNLCLNHLERHRNRFRLFSEMESEDGAVFEESIAEPGGSSIAQGLNAKLEEALIKLPQSQRLPLVLFHYEGMSYEEIARKMGVSLGKIKSDIFRGRAALRRILGEELA